MSHPLTLYIPKLLDPGFFRVKSVWVKASLQALASIYPKSLECSDGGATLSLSSDSTPEKVPQ